MKKYLIGALFIACTTSGIAQTKKAGTSTAKPSTVKPAAKRAAVAMQSAIDSFSYAIGLSIANFYRQQGVDNLNNSMVLQALADAKAKKPKLNEEQTNSCIIGYMETKKSEYASAAKKEGQAFLEENKKKDGIIVLPSGLQYQVIKEGTGAKPTLTDKVRVHYHGTLIDGRIFDSSVDRGQPIEFNVNGVIAGWTEALQLMPVGSKWKLFIPSEIGYGDNQAGALIKPGSTLLFDVELLDIVK